jgi:hypothetical protein
MLLREIAEHAQRLRALARKHEGELRGRLGHGRSFQKDAA